MNSERPAITRDGYDLCGLNEIGGQTQSRIQIPEGNVAPVFPAALTENVPEPFKSEPTGLAGNFGNRMHHKFVVIDFDKPTARVYMGSYNFSRPADFDNGENLLLIRDRRIAVSYMIEALRLFDHYHFRVAQQEAEAARHLPVVERPLSRSRLALQPIQESR